MEGGGGERGEREGARLDLVAGYGMCAGKGRKEDKEGVNRWDLDHKPKTD